MSTATEEMMLEPGGGWGKGVRRERKGGRERQREIETEVEAVSEGMTETEGGIFCRKHKERETLPFSHLTRSRRRLLETRWGRRELWVLGIAMDAHSA